MNIFKCCICEGTFEGFGNNPYPIVDEPGARCCDDCDMLVIQARIKKLLERDTTKEENPDESGEK